MGVGVLSVRWDAVTGASGYKVQWKSGSQSYDETNRQTQVTGTNHTIPVTAGTEYTVRVIAILADRDGRAALGRGQGHRRRQQRAGIRRRPTTASTLAENADGSATAIEVGMVSASDPDTDDTVTYSRSRRATRAACSRSTPMGTSPTPAAARTTRPPGASP